MAKANQPEYRAKAFLCPHCGTVAQQEWQDLICYHPEEHCEHLPELKRAVCLGCGKFSLWYGPRMLFPERDVVPSPNADLPARVREGYLEAKAILNRSPRSAAAILRLCLSEFCKTLGGKAGNLERTLDALVKKGLPAEIREGLRLMRVLGKDALKPGLIDREDDEATAIKLFEALNLIADHTITRPKQAASFLRTLPRRMPK
ncbi:MAG: DUF4145 domain-containing protein [Bacteroidota bacterium]